MKQTKEKHMLKRAVSLVSLILVIAVADVQAQVSITYSSGGVDYFSMTIPDEWRVNVGSEPDLSQNSGNRVEPARLISAMPNNGDPLWFGMWVPEDLEKIEAAQEYMTSLGIKLLADVVITEQKHDILNAMEVQYVSGTGRKNGEEMNFRAGFFQLSPEHVAIAIYIGPPKETISQVEDLEQMIKSLQPIIQ